MTADKLEFRYGVQESEDAFAVDLMHENGDSKRVHLNAVAVNVAEETGLSLQLARSVVRHLLSAAQVPNDRQADLVEVLRGGSYSLCSQSAEADKNGDRYVCVRVDADRNAIREFGGAQLNETVTVPLTESR